jgi:hypothetical protein
MPSAKRELAKLSRELHGPRKPLSPELEERRDWWREYLSNFFWTHFITLQFPRAPHDADEEYMQRAMRRFMAFIHHCVLGAYPRSLQELYGIRYFPVIQRGGLYGRLHMHILVCGGERLERARWEPWAAWWRKNYGAAIDIKNDIHDQNGVRDYVLNYMLRGDEFSPEPIRSTWGDEEERRRSREAPLFEKRKQGIEVAPSCEQWTRYRSFLSKHYDPPQRSTRYPLETSNGKYSAELPSAPHSQPGA